MHTALSIQNISTAILIKWSDSNSAAGPFYLSFLFLILSGCKTEPGFHVGEEQSCVYGFVNYDLSIRFREIIKTCFSDVRSLGDFIETAGSSRLECGGECADQT